MDALLVLSAKARIYDFLRYHSRRSGDCLIWRGGSQHVQIGRRYYKLARLAYQALIGPIPNGQAVRHRCEDELCIDRKHLYLAATTNSDITPAGHEHHSSQLDDCQALQAINLGS